LFHYKIQRSNIDSKYIKHNDDYYDVVDDKLILIPNVDHCRRIKKSEDEKRVQNFCLKTSKQEVSFET
jgi:hypothetical protein